MGAWVSGGLGSVGGGGEERMGEGGAWGRVGGGRESVSVGE